MWVEIQTVLSSLLSCSISSNTGLIVVLVSEFEALELDVSELDPDWWLSPRFREDTTIVKVPTTVEEMERIRENDADTQIRIHQLINKLKSMPQQHIAIVGHSAYFKRLLGMRRKLSNCEIVSVSLEEIVNRHQKLLN